MAGGALLVSGATGLLGGRLSAALQRDGVAVRALTRDPEAAAQRLAAEAEIVGWDGVHPPPQALAGARAVVHLAGAPVFAGPLTRSRRRRIYASRIDSTRAIAAALETTPGAERPAVLVCASAVGFYGSRGEEPLDEASPAGRSCRAASASTASAVSAMKAFFNGDWKILLMPPPFGTGDWQLYNLRVDPGEIVDLNDQYPERLVEMIAQWEQYKEDNGVLEISYTLSGDE